MAAFNVVMTAPRLAARALDLLRDAGCAVHFMEPYPSEAAVAALVGAVQADAVLSRQGRVGEAAMAASARLRVVTRHGVGVDDVDLAAAARRGVLVTRAPGSNTAAVAEHTMALLLALLKDLRPLGAAIEAGGWRDAATQARDAAGLRLGLVGYGAVGQAVARLAAAFGMRARAFDPAAAPGGAMADSLMAGSLAGLLGGSDAVSLHCPLTPDTRHLIGAAALASLPRGALLVNTARGGLVDEAALLAALDSGQLGGAGLDVTEHEPPPPDSPLRAHPRVILTPHVAGVTPAALDAMGCMAAECIVAALTGGAMPAGRVVAPA